MALTWEALVALEPELGRLEAEAATIRHEATVPSCANAVWYGYDGAPSLKARLVALVGWSRRHPEYERPQPDGPVLLIDALDEPEDGAKAAIRASEEAAGVGVLWSEDAYDIAYHRVYDALPFCVGCGC